MAVLPNDRLTLNAGVAQLVERYLAKVQVDGSSPFTRSNFEARWQSGYAAACKAVYAGSIPTLASTYPTACDQIRSRRICPYLVSISSQSFDDWI